MRIFLVLANSFFIALFLEHLHFSPFPKTIERYFDQAKPQYAFVDIIIYVDRIL